MRLLFLVAACALAGPAVAQVPENAPRPAVAVELKVGDPAPDFVLPGSDGKSYRLASLKGVRPVVLSWFPKANATL